MNPSEKPPTFMATLLRTAGLCFALIGSYLFMQPRAQAAGLLIADGGLGGVLEIQEQTVNVTINNGIAVTEVTQIFHNTENRQVEALYTFPVPKQASVSGFSMWINGKEMVGEVLEKDKARQIYNSYKAQRKDPGLLEQVDYKTFEMHIFPIPANAQQKVQIVYYQELDFDDDWATYVYPLATVTRKGLASTTKGRFALTLDAKSEIPIAEMKSPSHAQDFVIAQRSEDYVRASLETQAGDLNRDVVLAYRINRPHTGIDLIASRQGKEDGTFCLTVTAGEELAQLEKGMDYVFVLDISGSMANDGKLAISRDSVGAFIGALSPEDRYELIAFNVTPSMLFQKLAPATPENQAAAKQYLASQEARGGTELRPALELAYKYGEPDRPLNVVILSDGMTDQKDRPELMQMIAQRPSNAKVFCIGVGNEVNRPLLSQIASDTGGLASFISQGDDFERQAKAFRRKLMHPAATNLTLKFDGGDVYDLVPSKLPNLFHGTPVRVYGRYRQGGSVKVALGAEINGRPISMAGELTLPDQGDDNPEIERMWAWRKIDQLLAAADSSGNRDAAKDEVVRLGEGYSIATEYTSFLVLENDAEYKRWQIERKNAVRLERDRAKQQRLHSELEKMNEKAMASLAPAGTEAKVFAPAVADEIPLDAKPAVQTAASPTIPVANRPISMPTRPSRGFDLDLPAGGGGGALDPISGGLALALAAAAGYGRKKSRKSS